MRRWLLLPIAWLAALVSTGAHAQSLEGALMPGPVIAGHAKLEADCGNCHVRFDRAAQHRDLGEPAPPGAVPPDVKQHLRRLSVVNYTMWAHNAC